MDPEDDRHEVTEPPTEEPAAPAPDASAAASALAKARHRKEAERAAAGVAPANLRDLDDLEQAVLEETDRRIAAALKRDEKPAPVLPAAEQSPASSGPRELAAPVAFVVVLVVIAAVVAVVLKRRIAGA